MEEFSKDVYGLFETSPAPGGGECRNYTSHRVIAYHFDDAKRGGVTESRIEGIALSPQ